MVEHIYICTEINSVRFSNSTTHVVIVFTEFFYQTLNKKDYETLGISKTFDRVWDVGFSHKLNRVSGRIFNLIQFFLTDRVMKHILKGHGSWSLHIFESPPRLYAWTSDFSYLPQRLSRCHQIRNRRLCWWFNYLLLS